jgi:hypothetical protein
MTRSLFVALALVVCTARLASGQALALVGGAVARWNVFPDGSGVADAATYGGRIGLDLTDRLLLESDITYNSNVRVLGEPVAIGNLRYRYIAYQAVQTRLVWQQPVTRRGDILVGLGYAYDGFSRPRHGPMTGSGFAALGGVQHQIGPYLILRADATMHRMGSKWAAGYQIGLSTRLALAERASE